MDKTEGSKCKSQIRSEVIAQVERLMIPCYGGNKLLLARDLKVLKNNEEGNNGFGREKQNKGEV